MVSLCGSSVLDAVAPDLEKIISAGSQTGQLAQDVMEFCTCAQTRNQSVIEFAQRGQVVSRKLGTLENNGSESRGVLDASIFQILTSLAEQSEETLMATKEVEDIIQNCERKSQEMTETMEEGLDSLPHHLREKCQDNAFVRSDEDTQALEDIQNDIDDLNKCTESLQGMNLFSVTRSGARAFDGLVNKQEVCWNIVA